MMTGRLERASRRAEERALRAHPFMKQWSKNAPPEIMKGLEDSEPSGRVVSKDAKWHNVQFVHLTVDNAGYMGSLTISSCCNWCKHVPKDHFV